MLKVSSLFLFFFLSYQGHSTVSERLKTIAIDGGYGYKTANLSILEEKLSSLETEDSDFRYQVPDFFGISSESIQKFFKKNLKIDLNEEWMKILKESKLSEEEVLSYAFREQVFPEGFLQEAIELERKIQEAFKNFAESLSEEFSFQSLFPEAKDKGLIENLAKKNEHFMVRSTGREDTDELANAGGNESIAFVNPDLSSLLRATGQVIASYFSERSLTQRLLANDLSLVDPPFTPVLIQRMIEENREELPRVGVMFTDEPAAFQSKTFHRIEFSSLTSTPLIQAAYGHNGAVVDSLINVDSYLLKNKQIYPRILPKPFRMVPPKEDFVKNPEELVKASTLSEGAIQALGSLAFNLEEFYKKSMDVEFAIIGSTIYVLQARPLVANPNVKEPSYLNLTNEKFMKTSYAEVTPVGAAGGQLKMIKEPEELVFASTIKDALKAYQGLSNKPRVKAILIKEMAVATSHEATEFARQLKPVISLGDQFDTVSSWFKGGSSKFILDVQQARLVRWEEDEIFSIKNLIEEGYASKGWIQYPIPQSLSVINISNEELFDEKTSHRYEELYGDPKSEELKAFWESLTHTTHEESVKLSTVRSLLYNMKTSTKEEALLSLSKLWLWSLKILRQSKMNGYEERVKSLIHKLGEVFLTTAKSLEHEPKTIGYLTERLFYIQFLETLIFQDHHEREGVFGDSVLKILKETSREKKGASFVKKEASSFSKLAGMMTPYAFTEETKTKWITFINSFDESSKELQNTFFKELIFLGDLDLLTIWLNLIFPDSSENLENLVKEIEQEKDLLIKLAEQKKLLGQLETENFSNPKTFEKTWAFFQKNLLSSFLVEGEENFLTLYKKSGKLGKIASLTYFEELVSTFDVSIKSVTGSSLFTVTELPFGKSYDEVLDEEALRSQQIAKKKDKIFTFQLMLRDYLALLESLDGKKRGPYPSNNQNTLKNLAKNTLDKRQLEVRSFFDVNNVVRGSSVAIERRVEPETHEEFFTLVHQNLLILLSEFMKKLEISFEKFPENVKDYHEKISKITTWTRGMNGRTGSSTLIGYRFQENGFHFIYNLPQRNHSARIEYKENLKNKKSQITLHISGVGGSYYAIDRYEKIEAFNLLEGRKNGIPTDAFSMGSQGVEVKWEIKKENLDQVINFIENSCHFADHTDKLENYFKTEFNNTTNFEENLNHYQDFLRQGKILYYFKAYVYKGLRSENEIYIRKSLEYLQGLSQHFFEKQSLIETVQRLVRDSLNEKTNLIENRDFQRNLAENISLFFDLLIKNYKKIPLTDEQKRELVTYAKMHNEIEKNSYETILSDLRDTRAYEDKELVSLLLKNLPVYIFSSYPIDFYKKALDAMDPLEVKDFSLTFHFFLSSEDFDVNFKALEKFYKIMDHEKLEQYIKDHSAFFFRKLTHYDNTTIQDLEEHAKILKHFTSSPFAKEILSSTLNHLNQNFSNLEEAKRNLEALKLNREEFEEVSRNFLDSFIKFYTLKIYENNLDDPSLKKFVLKNFEQFIEIFKVNYSAKKEKSLQIFQIFFQLVDRPTFKESLSKVIEDIKTGFKDKEVSATLIKNLFDETKIIENLLKEEKDESFFNQEGLPDFFRNKFRKFSQQLNHYLSSFERENAK